MRRREFITLIGSAAVGWPLAVRAQQAAAMPVVGFLAPVWQNEELLGGFRQGLQHAGFVEGDNVSILYRSVENELDRLPALAMDLARRGVAQRGTRGSRWDRAFVYPARLPGEAHVRPPPREGAQAPP